MYGSINDMYHTTPPTRKANGSSILLKQNSSLVYIMFHSSQSKMMKSCQQEQNGCFGKFLLLGLNGPRCVDFDCTWLAGQASFTWILRWMQSLTIVVLNSYLLMHQKTVLNRLDQFLFCLDIILFILMFNFFSIFIVIFTLFLWIISIFIIW